MIKRIFFLAPLLILMTGCFGLEFAYSDFDHNKIKEKTLLSISGDNKNIIYSYLFGKIGETGSSPTYILSIASSSSIEAAVIEIDATASKFMIKHDLIYILNDVKNNCIIYEKNIVTNNLYDAKAEGYSFGTDLAEKELSTINLHSNIDQFLNELSINYSDLKCKNED